MKTASGFLPLLFFCRAPHTVSSLPPFYLNDRRGRKEGKVLCNFWKMGGSERSCGKKKKKRVSYRKKSGQLIHVRSGFRPSFRPPSLRSVWGSVPPPPQPSPSLSRGAARGERRREGGKESDPFILAVTANIAFRNQFHRSLAHFEGKDGRTAWLRMKRRRPSEEGQQQRTVSSDQSNSHEDFDLFEGEFSKK